MSTSSERRISSVRNALRVLLVLSEHPEGVGVTALAQMVGLGKSSVHILLATLADDDFVNQNEEGRYRLGLAAFEVGVAAVTVAAPGGPLTPLLRALAERSGEAVSLATPSGRDAIIVQRFESESILRAEIQIGTRMPLHCSASGKLLLSCMSESRIDALFPSEQLPGVTEKSVSSKRVLREQLTEIRAQQYARNEDEYTLGISGVAAGVQDANGDLVYALSLAGPTHRFNCDEWIPEVQNTAAAMSEVLGGLVPHAQQTSVKSGKSSSSNRNEESHVD